MTWFRGDDAFPQHPKVLAIPRRDRTAAVGLWALAGMWCSGQLTDGFVPDYLLEELAGTKRSAQHLVDVGLWERVDGGYQFHDWLNYNPSAEEVRAEQARKHEAKVRAGRSGGLASGVARRKHAGSTDEADAKQTGSKTKPRPVPSRSASNEALAQPPTTTPLRVVNPADNAGQIVGTWLDTVNRRPPSSVIAQLGKHTKALLADGYTPPEIAAALTAWHTKGLHPSTLPSVVNEIVNKPAPAAQREDAMWNP